MMGILFFIMRCFWFLWDNPRIVVVVLALALLLIVGLQMKGCFKPKPKFNEAEIQKAQKAVAETNRSEMIEVLAQSELREKNIDANVAASKAETLNSLHDSRIKYDNLTNEELAREIEARK